MLAGYQHLSFDLDSEDLRRCSLNFVGLNVK